ncbi:MAG: energy-coupling factor transporter transmembrane component T family protein [Nocardioidaceae bacterium]
MSTRAPHFPGALSLLTICVLPVVGALGIHGARQGAAVLTVQLLAVGWLVRDLRGAFFRLALGALAAVSVAVSTWLYGGRHLDATAAASLRVLAIVVPAAIVSSAIQPSDLGDQLAQRLHLPARPVVAAVAALQRIDSLAEDWRQVQRARRTRGLGVDGGPLRRSRQLAAGAFALLVVAMRHTGAMAEAMDARGFGTAQQRTWAEPAPWVVADSLVLALAVGLAVLPWLLR